MIHKSESTTVSSATPAVSVIIPVWNAEPYIGRCVESLQAQTLANIEMIFVDDCGSDASMELVEAAAEQDPRIRILRNEQNMGSGPSRNAGIDAARGEYLSFVDPDDWVAPDFLELLYEKAREDNYPDVVIGNVTRDWPKFKDPSMLQRRNISSSTDTIRSQLSSGTPLWRVSFVSHQRAIYRRTLLLADDTIRYGSGSTGEDAVFLLRFLGNAQTYSFAEDAVYHFVYVESSQTTSFSLKTVTGTQTSFSEYIDFFIDHKADPNLACAYVNGQWNMLSRRITRSVCEFGYETTADAILTPTRESLLRFPYVAKLKSKSLSIRGLIDHGLLLALEPGKWKRTLGLMYAADWVVIVREWVKFAELSHGADTPVLSQTLKAIKRSLSSLSAQKEFEDGEPARTEAFHLIRQTINESELRRLLVRDPRIAIFAAGGPALFGAMLRVKEFISAAGGPALFAAKLRVKELIKKIVYKHWKVQP